MNALNTAKEPRKKNVRYSRLHNIVVSSTLKKEALKIKRAEVKYLLERIVEGLLEPTLSLVSLTAAGSRRRILGTSSKIEKGNGDGFLSKILYLSPYKEAGVLTCFWATLGCISTCLKDTGRLSFGSAWVSRVSKTLWLFHYEKHFTAQLNKELTAFAAKCSRLGVQACIRLNGTSDLLWDRLINMADHPTIQFLDYTKGKTRLLRSSFPPNYFMVYSRTEDDTDDDIRSILSKGFSVAVVFKTPEQCQQVIREGYIGHPAVDGDENDLIHLHPAGSVIALYFKPSKGEHKHNKVDTGFIVDLEHVPSSEQLAA